MTTRSTIERIDRLYAHRVGYRPIADDGENPRDVLEILKWMRTAETVCPSDPAAYRGPVLKSAQLNRARTQPLFSIDEFYRMKSGNGQRAVWQDGHCVVGHRVVWQDGCELSYHDTTHEWHMRGPCGAKHVLHGTSGYDRVLAHWNGFRNRVKRDLTPVAP